MSQLSKTFGMLVVGAATLGLAAAVAAQTTTRETKEAGSPKVKTEKLKGEVVSVGEGTLVVKMAPSGEHRVFNIAPGKTFLIDGQPKTLAQLKPGTHLTADVTITETPVIERTTTVTRGKVFWSSPTSVIVTLENGENKQYAVKPDFKFEVDGEKVSAAELRRGMNLTGTRVVEEPANSITRDAVVTGTAPK